MAKVRQRAQEAVEEFAQDEQFGEFEVNSEDFLSARERGGTSGTEIEQQTASLSEASEILNRSFPTRTSSGEFVNVISPVVIPNRQSLFWRLLPIALLVVFVVVGIVAMVSLSAIPVVGDLGLTVFGPHFWLLLIALAVFVWWRQSVVMVPDGSQAVITRFGKLEEVVDAGRTLLFNPWKQVSYIVNTAKEYPYNAPIREAPTAGRVNASVDLFLQFRIEDPAEYIFTVGGVRGFADKLENAISEMTRALIYEQNAEDIYDLVGESTQKFLESLNKQFLPAVRFTNANITHAEALQPGVPDGPGLAGDGASGEGGVHLPVRAAAPQRAGRGRAEQRACVAAGDALGDTGGDRQLPGPDRYRPRAGDEPGQRPRPPADGRGGEHGQRQRGALGGAGARHPGGERRGGAGDPGVPLPAGRARPAGVGRREGCRRWSRSERMGTRH